jgi:hypothetical protein
LTLKLSLPTASSEKTPAQSGSQQAAAASRQRIAIWYGADGPENCGGDRKRMLLPEPERHDPHTTVRLAFASFDIETTAPSSGMRTPPMSVRFRLAASSETRELALPA